MDASYGETVRAQGMPLKPTAPTGTNTPQTIPILTTGIGAVAAVRFATADAVSNTNKPKNAVKERIGKPWIRLLH